MDYFVFRLKKGDDLREKIMEFADDNDIQSGAIVSAVGSVSEIRIRKADGVNEYFEVRDYEIISLSGTISKDGPHFHIGLSDEYLNTIGGHLLVGTKVKTTAEIVLMKFDKYTLSRKYDETSGYNELEVVLNERL